ncbi:sodium:solute symporter family transporter, partial [Streptomyces venezuelae]|uniref:sodium:solute symporter family transporter n=1 Tax=Streptomyces venezuelae TaxID=54571 RepID=UPI0036458C39
MTVAAFQMPDALPTVFMLFLGLCGLTWLFTASGNDNTAMLPGRREPGKPWYSGLAISGESLSAVTLLSIVGLIALTGFDGMMLSLGCVMGLALLALVLAEPLRRAGGHTVGDALSTHFPQRSVRLGVGIATLAVCLPYVVLQLTAIGSLTAFVLGGFTGVASKAACTIVIGVLMVSLAVSGGMRGTAWMQIVKVVVLVVVMGAVAVAVLRHLHGSPFRLLSEAAAHSGLGERYLGPGVQYGSGGWAVADRGGQFVALALGVCCLPQVTMRVLTAPAGRATRTAMHWAVGQLLLVSALVVVAGIGAAAVLGGDALRAVDPSGGSALLLLADRLDPGGTLLSVVFCVVFLTALTTVADVTLAAATTVARDLLPRAAGPDGAPHRHLERRARAAGGALGRGAGDRGPRPGGDSGRHTTGWCSAAG